MQMIAAKCVMEAWDSVSCILYKPGQGPLPGGLYEIDRHGPLARLERRKGGEMAFEFDRNAGPDDKPHDYSCKQPGCESLKPFKTLNDLGTHTRTAHKAAERESSDDVPVVADGRGKKKGKTFTCKHPGCGQVFPNLYAISQHNKTHKQPEVAATEAA